MKSYRHMFSQKSIIIKITKIMIIMSATQWCFIAVYNCLF